jgi:hypothetical protein
MKHIIRLFDAETIPANTTVTKKFKIPFGVKDFCIWLFSTNQVQNYTLNYNPQGGWIYGMERQDSTTIASTSNTSASHLYMKVTGQNDEMRLDVKAHLTDPSIVTFEVNYITP